MLIALQLIFMSLQKAYWPYYFRNDNLFMDKAHFMILLLPLINNFDGYLIVPLVFPFTGYISQLIKKD